jgi:hypothetical protein
MNIFGLRSFDLPTAVTILTVPVPFSLRGKHQNIKSTIIYNLICYIMSHYADEGNIAELEFGKEFIFSVDGSGGSETRCLTNDETFVILDKLKKNREGNE